MQKNNCISLERLDTIDIAKGIGILFVVFAHVNYTPELLVLIYSFHMPLFFIISGMMFQKEKYKTFTAFFKRKVQTLIVPYIIFSVCSIGYAYVSEQIFPELFDISRTEYLQYLRQVILAQGSHPVLNTPLWFVLCLFAVEIMYYFIAKFSTKSIVVIVMAISSFGWLLESSYLPFDNTLLPWTFDTACFALGFYAFGNLIFPKIKQIISSIKKHNQKKQICILLFLVCIIVWLPITLINGKVSLGSRVLNNGFFFYWTGITGTMAILAISILLEKNKFLIWCGRNTFCIMSSHYMIRKFLLPKYYALLEIPLYNRKELDETILPFLIILAITLLFTGLYSRVKHYYTINYLSNLQHNWIFALFL